VLTIHGDADPVVPYDQATRFHKALDGAGVPNELITIEGGGHGGFKTPDMEHIYKAIRAFLARHGIAEAHSRLLRR
jgi:dipeptidyl aminopeptidase/acylaminoacyl peptidase